MNRLREVDIAVCLIVAIAALVIVARWTDTSTFASTGLRDLVLLLGGALAGSKVPTGKE